jgi:hypothetical protein
MELRKQFFEFFLDYLEIGRGKSFLRPDYQINITQT